MLSITKLKIQTKEEKELVSVKDISVQPGTISLIVGRNGSGKTSFLHGLFLHPGVTCVEREISLQGEDISSMSLLEMYMNGLQYVPQHLMPLPGVSFISFLHVAYETKFSEKISLFLFVDTVKKICTQYGLPQYVLEKNVHENLSGGERKIQELIQVIVLKPKYLFLDEIDAGLDRDAKTIVATVLNQLKKEGIGILLVSHSFEFTELLTIDAVQVMDHGSVIRVGDKELLQIIQKDGFAG